MPKIRKIKSKGRKRPRKQRKPDVANYLYRGMNRDQLIVPRRFRAMPPSLVTNLVFMDTNHSPLNNAGATFASVRFRPSSAFDVDPTLGGTSMPGFNEIAGIYGRYRMLSFKAQVIATNLEDFPVNFIVFASNFDLGNNYSQVQSMFGNSFSRYKYLSPKGGMDRATIRTPWWKTEHIVGTDAVNVDTDFTATISASPVNNTYLNIGLWTGNSTALVSGVGMQMVLTAQYRFYENFHLVTQPDPPDLHPELIPKNEVVELKQTLDILVKKVSAL